MAKTNDNRPSPYKAKGPPCGENRRLRKLFATKEIICKSRPELMHGAEDAAAIDVLFDQSKLVSRDLRWQTDSQIGYAFEKGYWRMGLRS
jgi:hypothetical protein